MIRLFISVLLGLAIWLCPVPEGISTQGWHLLAIFISTMLAVILKPFPMSVISLFSLSVATATHTLTLAEALNGFSHEIVWLIVLAFFVARGFISTGLGSRLAYQVMSLLGKNSLGLGYGLVATDLLLAPAIPSVTARIGGIVYPIAKALAEIFTGSSSDPRMGGFLTATAFQGCVITSAMFLTAMAGNPLLAELAGKQGVEITWASWCIAASVPGLLSLLIVPYVLFKFIAPATRKTPRAKEMAQERLARMGSIKPQEWTMIFVFCLLIVLWVLGPFLEMKATVAALIGVSILLLTGTLRLKDLLEETAAWDTFIWFSVLVTLSGFLNQFGVTAWFGQWVVAQVSGLGWIAGFLIALLIYFYSHYFFASSVAHVGAMFAPFLTVAIGLGTPPGLAALSLIFFSNLFGGLTHYGFGPAPILFGAGYLSVKEWWQVGLLASVVNIAIWLGVGSLWWHFLGIW